MSGPHRGAAARAPTPAEAMVVVALCFGWFIYGSLWSVAYGFSGPAEPGGEPFSDAGLQSLLTMELVLGTLALLFLRWRGHRLDTVLPVPTVRGGLIGLALWGLSLGLWWLMAPLFSSAEHAVQPIRQMTANLQVSTAVVLAVSIVNGLYEEVFVLGLLVRAFEHRGASFAIGISVLVRLMYHLYQGPIGALSAAAFGVLMGLFYWRTRQLWPAVFAHIVADAMALG